MDYEIEASRSMVSAWSVARLPFEPRGWQRRFRGELRLALRALEPEGGHGLIAEYDAPNDAFVDVENVLLYNVGAGAYGHLLGPGLVCRRGSSTDGRHHLRYALASVIPDPDPGATCVIGDLAADLGDVLPRTPGEWWMRLRPRTTIRTGRPAAERVADSFVLDLSLAGPNLPGRRSAGIVKALLDGVVSCFHAHDASAPDVLLPRLASLALPKHAWDLVCEPSTAVLGVRPLVRPHGKGIAWNPADERCYAFRVAFTYGTRWKVHAQLRVLA
ncbi:hypothetical protein ACFYWN_36840 [Streptomyces sp. NPDC002917]|uniref:hypothetical protein n=1 Tax=unclassified Streptomyces TaxID=2593676 RepID=UPI002E81CC1A|nr:hypothetical protein [Streptomyces sp. NBC_00562]WTC76928.1 hypothetical protein OH719_02470 [Streptomyces sp. NBC_01653]WTD93932.1 hypothetical protein OG891_44390 [Streptomyces sp. NBC_01637]WUC24963.1 hypothetical protein OHA33_43070 [Streptomyces sp. NBC_00562]